MLNVDLSVAENGKQVYKELEQMLMATAPGQYVAIEPTSKEYFIARSMGDAIMKGKLAYPHRQFYATAIGKPVHLPVR